MSGFDDMELLELLNDENHTSYLPRNQTIPEYMDGISDSNFFEAYSMTKRCFFQIFESINYPNKVKGNYYGPEFELLTLLRYLASGSFMLISGN